MLNLAVLQFRPTLGRWEENLKRVMDMLGHIREGSLVALPEMWSCGFDYGQLSRHADATPEVLEELRKISSEKRLTLIGTYPTRGDGGIYNSAIIVGEGRILGIRHKIRLFPLYEEDRHFLQGRENPVFHLGGVGTGILICFELRFPELSWSLREAELLVVPSMWGKGRREHLMVLSRARAVENQCFLSLSNAWGRVGTEEYAGCSAIYSPWGDVLAFSQEGDCILQVVVDRGEVSRVRELIPLSKHSYEA